MLKKFDGKYKISIMQSNDFDWKNVSNDIGVYVVAVEDNRIALPLFFKKGVGGYFKNRNPNVLLEELNNNWIEFSNSDERILYIGKAGGSGESNLRKRIKQYMRFGQGRSVGHWGGRYIWQLRGVDDLYVYWKKCDNPESKESKLLSEFKDVYGDLPFANLRM